MNEFDDRGTWEARFDGLGVVLHHFELGVVCNDAG
jgi:hypothetical protein